MRRVELRGSALASIQDVHETLKAALDFPKYYGSNLDALADCLTEMHEETEIVFTELPLLKEQLGEKADRLLRVLQACAGENPQLHITICL